MNEYVQVKSEVNVLKTKRSNKRHTRYEKQTLKNTTLVKHSYNDENDPPPARAGGFYVSQVIAKRTRYQAIELNSISIAPPLLV